MQNPFTITFSKAPEYTYIATSKTAEILDNFSYEKPSESVYKITGVRGLGKNGDSREGRGGAAEREQQRERMACP